MSYLSATALAFPKHQYSQEQLSEALIELWGSNLHNPDRLRQFFSSVEVGSRFLALAKEEYADCRTFAERNLAWRRVALELSTELVPRALAEAGLNCRDLSVLMSTTVTGLAVPTLEARLMNRLPIPKGVSRYPLFGLGCLGGAAGLARLHEVVGGTDKVGLLLAVELCSLTLQTADLSVANLISTGLFGDGAGALVLVGSEHPASKAPGRLRCRVVASQAEFFPDSEQVMGWEFDEHGFQVVLAPTVPDFARVQVVEGIQAFLKTQGLSVGDISHWIAHPGGPKVIQALEEGLGVPGALEISRRSLAEIGNLSSVSVLAVLHQVLCSGEARPGDWGLVLAMGPAFCAEMVLLRWEP